MPFPVDWTDLISDDQQARSKSLYNRNGDVFLVIHHAYNRTVYQTIDTFKSPNRTVSAQFAFGPKRVGVDECYVVRTVAEGRRAYTTASSIDDKAITVECSNLSLTAPYPVGKSVKRRLAELAAYMHTEYKMPLDRWHVTSHQEVYQRGWGSYATACPGGDLQGALDWIVAEAKRIVSSGPAGDGGTVIGGKEVIAYRKQDVTARKSGRTVDPGKGFYLNTTSVTDVSKASNIVGGIGEYSITGHVYAEGAPGDVLDLVLLWDDTKTGGQHSSHYAQRFVFDKNGRIYENVEWKRAVTAGYAVYLRADAPSSNTKPVKVTVLDSDAYLFVS